MRYLGACGFEANDNDANGIIIDSGGFWTAPDTTVPGSSLSTYSLTFRGDVWHRPWYEGSTATSTARTPSGTRWGFQFIARLPVANADIRFGVSSDATERISLSKDVTTGFLCLYVNGAKVADSPSYVWSLDTFRRFTVDVLNTTSGHIKVYAEGDVTSPVIDYTLPSAVTVPNSFWGSGFNASGIFVDDMIAWEWGVGLNPDLLEEVIDASIQWRALDGAGNYADWTDGSAGAGTYDLIDERPYSDTDFIESTSVDEVSTFTHEDVTEDRVLFANVLARVTRAGTDAGSNIQIVARSGATDLNFPSSATGAPGDGFVIVPIDSEPDGTRLEDAADFNAIEFGPITRT